MWVCMCVYFLNEVSNFGFNNKKITTVIMTILWLKYINIGVPSYVSIYVYTYMYMYAYKFLKEV